MASALIYNEQYGDVTRAQQAAYRKYNVSPSDHGDLVWLFGEADRKGIIEFVIEHSKSGTFRMPFPAETVRRA